MKAIIVKYDLFGHWSKVVLDLVSFKTELNKSKIKSYQPIKLK